MLKKEKMELKEQLMLVAAAMLGVFAVKEFDWVTAGPFTRMCLNSIGVPLWFSGSFLCIAFVGAMFFGFVMLTAVPILMVCHLYEWLIAKAVKKTSQ